MSIPVFQQFLLAKL